MIKTYNKNKFHFVRYLFIINSYLLSYLTNSQKNEKFIILYDCNCIILQLQ